METFLSLLIPTNTAICSLPVKPQHRPINPTSSSLSISSPASTRPIHTTLLALNSHKKPHEDHIKKDKTITSSPASRA
ncbi:hypothetical protein BU24DRAFT_426329 [Aaosphaeria arxii CBS 175.79]|uniref:Uncharacterized protein n=1 Tax=Aaosphaeria arxii CBS 175.79 TaxID=1450172 RepID=A0A6A5XEL8_9PLEO|nr:uncharacterized protein BU24DRAFT_426329 [Aaosphaeria arxii CBS 175.79]KAF2011247.1 hypothetical protein BU24DRAFT_426329 [Aaosphaeria arxii CBS 175.79]